MSYDAKNVRLLVNGEEVTNFLRCDEYFEEFRESPSIKLCFNVELTERNKEILKSMFEEDDDE